MRVSVSEFERFIAFMDENELMIDDVIAIANIVLNSDQILCWTCWNRTHADYECKDCTEHVSYRKIGNEPTS
jgi:hypothetical protein